MSDEKKKRGKYWRAATWFTWRGYRCKETPKGLKCIASALFIDPHAPKSFIWTSLDPEGAKQYIDALLESKLEVTLDAEKRGKVIDIEQQPPETGAEDHKWVMINLNQLLHYLALTDRARLPLRGKIRLVTNEAGKFMPTELAGALIAHCPRSFPPALYHGDWETVTAGNAAAGALTSGANLPDGVTEMTTQRQAPQMESAPAQPPPEIEIAHQSFARYVEFITRVDAEEPYYVRRLMTLSGSVFYAASSFVGPQGPWHVYQRANGLMLAFGCS